MDSAIDAIFQMLHEGSDIRETRKAIAGLIVEQLEEGRDSFGHWEKAHFANAIAALAWNMNSSDRSSQAWLRLCLVNVEKALIPKDQRNEHYGRRYDQFDWLSVEQLLQSVRELGP